MTTVTPVPSLFGSNRNTVSDVAPLSMSGKKTASVPGVERHARVRHLESTENFMEDNMERLTKVIPENVVLYIGEHKKYDADIPAEMSTTAVRDVLHKLAAYEDTGLSPEQIAGGRWISVSERLPIDEYERYRNIYDADPEFIVVISGAAASTVLQFHKDDDGQYHWHDGENCYSVSHWRRLPLIPEEVRNG